MLEEQFEKGFQETLTYKESTGNPNAPCSIRRLKVSGLAIGKVVKGKITRKETYLKKDQATRNIGFTWDILEEQFEQGFQETLKYKKSTGTSNAPFRYKTAKASCLAIGKIIKNTYKKGKIFRSDQTTRIYRFHLE